jgi:hypothetical protein
MGVLGGPGSQSQLEASQLGTDCGKAIPSKRQKQLEAGRSPSYRQIFCWSETKPSIGVQLPVGPAEEPEATLRVRPPENCNLKDKARRDSWLPSFQHTLGESAINQREDCLTDMRLKMRPRFRNDRYG